VTSLDLCSEYLVIMELRYDAMYSNLRNGKFWCGPYQMFIRTACDPRWLMYAKVAPMAKFKCAPFLTT